MMLVTFRTPQGSYILEPQLPEQVLKELILKRKDALEFIDTNGTRVWLNPEILSQTVLEFKKSKS